MSELVINIKSKILGMPTDVRFLLPDPPRGVDTDVFYASGKKYKVLWMLHGAEGNGKSFFYETDIVNLAAGKDMIIACPDGLNSDFANHPQLFGGYEYTTFFFEELMPLVQNWFPASADPKDNFLTGYSMGGSGTLLLGFEHPEKFGGIAPFGTSVRESEFLKPYREMTSAQFRELTAASPTDFPTEYGPQDGGILLKEVNMICKYPTVGGYIDSYECMWERFPEKVRAGKLPKKVMFGCGDSDLAKQKILAFKEYAESFGIEVFRYEFVSGYGHEIAVCNDLFPRMFEYFGL